MKQRKGALKGRMRKVLYAIVELEGV